MRVKIRAKKTLDKRGYVLKGIFPDGHVEEIFEGHVFGNKKAAYACARYVYWEDYNKPENKRIWHWRERDHTIMVSN